MTRRLLIWIGVLCLVLIIGCSNETKNTTNVVDPAKVGQDEAPTEPTNLTEEVDSNTPEEDATVETDPSVMADFQALVDKKAKAAELKVFVDSQVGKVAVEDYTDMVIALEDSQQDQLLALEDRFYNGAEFQEQLWDLNKDDEFDYAKIDTVTNPDLKKLLIDTRDGGYKLETAEGSYFPVIDYEEYEKYQAYVSEDIRDYIEIKAIESKVVSLKDGGMIIGWDEVVKRAVRQETFIANYPNSVRTDEMKRLFGGYVYVSFNGVDNTPLFNYDNNMFEPEVKTAYTDAVRAGTDSSPYLKRLSVLLDLIEKSGSQMSDEVTNYQQETTDLWSNSNE